MKKTILLAMAVIASLTIRAEVKTLDLSTATGAFFNENGLWTGTYSDAVADREITFNEGFFKFSHPVLNSYGGSYWYGFTVSRRGTIDDITVDGYGTMHTYGWANMAQGGIGGVGTPYILSYWSAWDAPTNVIKFSNKCYPRYVYLNNAQIGYASVTAGSGVARPFHEGDYFEIVIKGLDENFAVIAEKEVRCSLADFTASNSADWIVNTDWVKFNLSNLGEVYGLSFTLTSTDNGGWGMNTAAYFALDGLTVSTEENETLPAAEAIISNVTTPDNYTRTGLTVNKYGTICLPRKVAEGNYSGAIFYKVIDINPSNWIELEEVGDLEAGQAYIFKATATTINCTYTGAAVKMPALASTANVLQGTFVSTIVPGSAWFLNDNKLWASDGSYQSMSANRAYLTTLMPEPPSSSPAPGRHRVQLPIQQAPTELQNVEAQDAQAVKVMQNGVLYIQKNGNMYNLQGQIVK